ncbi:MAG: hypothetical protein ACRCYV_00190 [Aeromonas sp.]
MRWNELGTPTSTRFDDLYFSNTYSHMESRYVFLAQNDLPARWVQCSGEKSGHVSAAQHAAERKSDPIACRLNAVKA